MITLRSFVCGKWVEGAGEGATLLNPATEVPLATANSNGVDFQAALAHARTVGGPALRELSFGERAQLVGALYTTLHAHRDELIAPAIANGGNTRSDAKFDIDGAWGTLAYYAQLGESLGSAKELVEGESLQLSRSARFHGGHILTPRHGVAVHINAFNFPAWGFAEKAACALLAGMPIVVKPATATALLAYRIMELVVESKLLPDGALSFIAGQTGDLLSRLEGQDVLAFTGSSSTGAELRSGRAVIECSVRVNVEADSLNAAVLCADAERGSPAYELFLTDVVRDMTQKAGQKCTAIRRVLVPTVLAEAVQEDLAERLSAVKVGDPARDEVTMGPLATAQQLADVRAGIAHLRTDTESVFGDGGAVSAIGVPTGRGFFVGPVLLRAHDPATASTVHAHEVFGPVATLLPYDGTPRSAVALLARSGGMLVSSIYGDARETLVELARGLAPYCGRIFLGSSKLVGQASPPGTVLPQLIHGGPGRAGGGQELGGLQGLHLYLQRTALQADKPLLDQLTGRG